MTKKDYISIADIFKRYLNEGGTVMDNATEWLLTEFISLFKADNSKFDEQRFRNYIKSVK